MNTRIAKIRKSSNLTQEQFGQKMGISKNYVNLIENGKKNPGDRLISDICQEFEINEDWLRTGDGEMKKPINTDYEVITTLIGEKDPKAKQAIIDYYHLTDSDKKLWWSFVDRFLKGAED